MVKFCALPTLPHTVRTISYFIPASFPLPSPLSSLWLCAWLMEFWSRRTPRADWSKVGRQQRWSDYGRHFTSVSEIVKNRKLIQDWKILNFRTRSVGLVTWSNWRRIGIVESTLLWVIGIFASWFRPGCQGRIH